MPVAAGTRRGGAPGAQDRPRRVPLRVSAARCLAPRIQRASRRICRARAPRVSMDTQRCVVVASLAHAAQRMPRRALRAAASAVYRH
ncbi:protein of unknown function [Burkholderia multivorans]